MFIYEIKNVTNKKRYIGQTARSPNRRWSEHLYNLRHNKHGNPHLQNAWNKYGEAQFEFNVLAQAISLDELNSMEIDLVQSTNLYNIRSGGVLFRHNESTKQKISNSRQGIVAWNKGIKTNYMTPNIKHKLSKSLRPDGYPTITHLDGRCVTIQSLRSTAKELKLDQTGLRKLVDGDYNSYHGWTVSGNQYVPRSTMISKAKRVSGYPPLISPNGTIYSIEDTLRSFCRHHNLTPSMMSNLINKKIPSYKGWKLQEQFRA